MGPELGWSGGKVGLEGGKVVGALFVSSDTHEMETHAAVQYAVTRGNFAFSVFVNL